MPELQSSRRNRFVLSLCALFVIVAALTGCVGNKPYRTAVPGTPPAAGQLPSIEERASSGAGGPNFDLAYIEFDDMGEYWTIGDLSGARQENNSQLERAVSLIQKREKERPVAVITFVHGWKNNASKYDDEHAKNLKGFKEQLQKLAADDRSHAYVGVFIAWRGQAVSGNLFSSYWNRRAAAGRVGGPSMTEALFRLMFVTKPPVSPTQENACGSAPGLPIDKRNLFIVIGHSFGARVLETAISQPIMALIYERRTQADACRESWNSDHQQKLGIITFDRPADLIVTINAANDAFAAKAMIEGMQRMNLRACVDEECSGKGSYFDSPPLIISILSDGDSITRKLMPVAQAFSYPAQNLNRAYDKNAQDEGQIVLEKQGKTVIPKQSSFYFHNEGSIDALISHKVALCGAVPLRPCSPLCFSNGTATFDLTPVALVDTSKRAFTNRTPFWVFSVPAAIIPNHSDLFQPGTNDLLQMILKKAISRNQTMSAD